MNLRRSMYRFILISMLVTFSLISVASAIAATPDQIKKITLSTKGINHWEEIDWHKIAIDDYENIYVLKDDRVHVYNENGLLKKNIKLETRGSHFEVTAKGKSLLIINDLDLLIINMSGELEKRVKGLYSQMKRTCRDVYVDTYNKPMYDINLNPVKDGDNISKPFSTSKGNYYVAGHGLYKHNQSGEVIWKKDILGLRGIIGVDENDNVYAKIENKEGWKIQKLNNEGNMLSELTLPGYILNELNFDQEDLESLQHYDSEEPFQMYKMDCKGNIYIIYSFWQYPKNAKRKWLKGGKYYIYKIDMTGNDQNIIQKIANTFKDKKYFGAQEVYTDKKILVENVSNGGRKIYVRALRNEIFARHGRMFKSDDLRAIFESTDWYKPDPNYSDDMLNDIEKKNVQFILDYEKKMRWR